MSLTRKMGLAFLAVVWVVAHILAGIVAAFIIALGIEVVSQLMTFSEYLGPDRRSETAKLFQPDRPAPEGLELGGFAFYELVAGVVLGLIAGVARTVVWFRAEPPKPEEVAALPEDQLPPFVIGLIAGILVPLIAVPILMLLSGLIWLVTGYATLEYLLSGGLVIASVLGLLLCITGWEMPSKPT